MAKYAKKPVVVDALTFDEFVEYAKSTTPFPHCRVKIADAILLRETDDSCLCQSPSGGYAHFTKNSMLVIDEYGHAMLMRIEKFEDTFDKI